MKDYKKIMEKIETIKYERRLDILIRRRIIWRQEPTTDVPTETHSWGWWYKEGTHQNYCLFNTRSRISTANMFSWHLRVLWYLNPAIDLEDFRGTAYFIGDTRHGFTMFDFKKDLIDGIVDNILKSDLEKPPPNTLRKIVFKEHHGLTLKEQQQISGKYGNLGSGISPDEVYEEMLRLNEQKIKITLKNLAKNLDCTIRTVHRNLDDVLRAEKKQLNLNLKAV